MNAIRNEQDSGSGEKAAVNPETGKDEQAEEKKNAPEQKIG